MWLRDCIGLLLAGAVVTRNVLVTTYKEVTKTDRCTLRTSEPSFFFFANFEPQTYGYSKNMPKNIWPDIHIDILCQFFN
jgi:hypothetical protein